MTGRIAVAVACAGTLLLMQAGPTQAHRSGGFETTSPARTAGAAFKPPIVLAQSGMSQDHFIKMQQSGAAKSRGTTQPKSGGNAHSLNFTKIEVQRSNAGASKSKKAASRNPGHKGARRSGPAPIPRR